MITFLPLPQTMSSLFSPAGGPPDGLMLSICTVAANAPRPWPSKPATRHQDTHRMLVYVRVHVCVCVCVCVCDAQIFQSCSNCEVQQ